jgi:hypothetical protein
MASRRLWECVPMNSKRLLGLCFGILLAILAYFLGCDPKGKEIRTLRGMTRQERLEAFASMDPQKQLDLHLAAQQGEPGDNFSFYVAPNWRTVLPALERRLSSEKGDAEKIQLLWLLATIGGNYCSLAERSDVIDAAAKALATISTSNKSYAEEHMKRAFHPAKVLTPCH